MKRALFTAAAFAALVPAIAHADETRIMHVPGSMCVPTKDSRNHVDYNQYGLFNTHTLDPAIIECPLTTRKSLLEDQIITRVTVWGYDRNLNADLSCELRATDADGTVRFSRKLATRSNTASSGPTG